LEQRGLTPTGRVNVGGLDREGRRALGQLLGQHLTRDRIQLDLAELDSVARNRLVISGGLVGACEDVLGRRLVDRALVREQTRQVRDEPIAAMRAAVAEWPKDRHWATEWIADVSRIGLLSRAGAPDTTAEQAVHLVDLLLPVSGAAAEGSRGLARNELAARECGSAHALDDGTVLAAVVLRGLALAAELPPPATPRQRRELWQAFGVEHDQVSSSVLTLGIRSRADDALGTRLALAAGDFDPVHLTARNVASLSMEDLRAGRVLVCENPRVLEVAANLHAADTVMVCTMGNPSIAVVDFLRKLAGAGAILDYHGDFDWPGLSIAARVAEATGASPWRMSTDDYLAAVADARGHLTLEGAPGLSPWDPGLAEAMRTTNLAVHEEALLPGLVQEWLDDRDGVGRDGLAGLSIDVGTPP
jgi:uncharacterized protein (TIGR02679 family)